MLTALAVLVGTATVVASMGLTGSAADAVSRRFDRLEATTVRLEPTDPDTLPYPTDTGRRLTRIDGVTSGGVLYSVPPAGEENAFVAPPHPQTGRVTVPVVAAGAGAIAAAQLRMRDGHVFDSAMEARREHVALVGRDVAEVLALPRLETRPRVHLGGIAFTVIGVIEETAREPDLLGAVTVPDLTARALWPDAATSVRVLIDVRLGHAQQVGRQAAPVLHPHSPGLSTALVPPDPRSLRQDVETDIGGLAAAVAGVALIVAMLVIANASLVAVIERTGEIGLRRALGATRLEVASQFLLESAAIGSLGGVAGTAVGVVVVVGSTLVRGWVPVLQVWVPLAVPALGALTGLVAGAYPAARAANVQPARAVRGAV